MLCVLYKCRDRKLSGFILVYKEEVALCVYISVESGCSSGFILM